MTKCWGIVAKNKGQEEVLKCLVNQNIELLFIEGVAGSGKTLLTIAAGLEQTIESKQYHHIIFTRAPIPIGESLGFLPGNEKDKMSPWCGALVDNLELLVGDNRITRSIVESKIKICAMEYMRGRTFTNAYVIIDEIQNITKQELKVLLSRAGENCKIICLGDLSQVDNKKINLNNSSLIYYTDQVDRCSVNFIKSLKLQGCVRSKVAKWVVDIDE